MTNETCTLSDPMLAQRYYDGEASAADAARYQAHLAVCPSCRERMALWSQIGAALREAYPRGDQSLNPDSWVRAVRDRQLQTSRRVTWGLLAAASMLLVASLSFAGYTRAGGGEGSLSPARWEAYVVAAPVIDEDYSEMDSRTLLAIHVQQPAENRND